MNTDAQPPDQDGGNFVPLSLEEFRQWVRDPANAKRWREFVDAGLPELPADAPPEIIARWQNAVAKRQTFLAVEVVQQKMKALLEIMQRPAGTMYAEDRLAQCRSLMQEITDAALETPEPHRTTFLKQLLPVREALMALKAPE